MINGRRALRFSCAVLAHQGVNFARTRVEGNAAKVFERGECLGDVSPRPDLSWSRPTCRRFPGA